MMKIQDGQCGLCKHFGEHDDSAAMSQLIQIRTRREAPADLKEECGHPKHEPLHLMVTPIASCEGFAPATN